jgi:hypothetical protein
MEYSYQSLGSGCWQGHQLKRRLPTSAHASLMKGPILPYLPVGTATYRFGMHDARIL